MNRDEILAMSRDENKTGDEMLKQYQAEAGMWAFLVGGIVFVLLVILETTLLNETNHSAWAICFVMASTNALVLGIRLKNKIWLGAAGLFFVLAGFHLVTYIMQVVGR